MLRLTSTGNFDNFRRFAFRVLHHDIYNELDRWGQMGVDALSAATPTRTGRAASSWRYRIRRTSKQTRIEWYNTDEINGVLPIVILLQYGHATGTGGYVKGRDFINPAMRPVFDQIASEFSAELTSS